MNGLKAITTVYSYYLPEIRNVIDDMTREYPHEAFLKSMNGGLDDFHLPVMDKLVDVHRDDVSGLGKFGYRYSTAGSEEGIREFMSLLALRGVNQAYMWKGDYEGYRETGKTRGIRLEEVEFGEDPKRLKPGYWFLSNPSARNGLIIGNTAVRSICEAGHKVFYDLSYLGSTRPFVYDLGHPNVVAAAVSFSKPYGLFYYRVGFLYTREEVPSLYANKWFKNIYGLMIAKAILERVDIASLAEKYKNLQREIVGEINREHGLGLHEADTFLLANLPCAKVEQFSEAKLTALQKFRRHNFYRFCLTPYFLAREERGVIK